MKALSLSQPWCWSIFDPIADKDIENRSWPPPVQMIGETIAVHAAKSWDDQRQYMKRGEGWRGLLTPIGYFLSLGIAHAPARREDYAAGAIVGVATIAGVVTDDTFLLAPNINVRWYFGPYGWLWPNRRKLATPIPCSGKQGLWTVPVEIEKQIYQQLGTVN